MVTLTCWSVLYHLEKDNLRIGPTVAEQIVAEGKPCLNEHGKPTGEVHGHEGNVETVLVEHGLRIPEGAKVVFERISPAGSFKA